MLDNKLLRQNIDEVSSKLKRRGFDLDVASYQALEDERKVLQEEAETLQAKRNLASKQIGLAKSKGEDTSAIMADIDGLSASIKEKNEKLGLNLKALDALLSCIPNITVDEVPVGKDDTENLEIKTVGQPPIFSFKPRDHVELGEALGLMDFEAAVKIASGRFVVLKGVLARLQRALIQFMLDTHTSLHGYQETYVPYLANQDSLFGTTQLPKFREDLFNLEGGQFALIPTAEVSLTNIARNEIYSIAKLPVKMTAHTPCFRSEAGSYGKDTRGMFRQHQFEKIELVMLAHPEQSDQLHEELTRHAETILEKLELPYRRMLLCTGDTGFASAKTYDLEVWLPGQARYREISSCSHFKDFQARRLQARFRNPETDKPELLHTLNGSGLAVGRTLIAVMENYQEENGDIRIPTVLQPYMNNQAVIR